MNMLMQLIFLSASLSGYSVRGLTQGKTKFWTALRQRLHEKHRIIVFLRFTILFPFEYRIRWLLPRWHIWGTMCRRGIHYNHVCSVRQNEAWEMHTRWLGCVWLHFKYKTQIFTCVQSVTIYTYLLMKDFLVATRMWWIFWMKSVLANTTVISLSLVGWKSYPHALKVSTCIWKSAINAKKVFYRKAFFSV